MKDRPVINGARDAVDYLMREFILDQPCAPRVYAGLHPYSQYEVRVQRRDDNPSATSFLENREIAQAIVLAAGIMKEHFGVEIERDARGSHVLLDALHHCQNRLQATTPTKD